MKFVCSFIILGLAACSGAYFHYIINARPTQIPASVVVYDSREVDND